MVKNHEYWKKPFIWVTISANLELALGYYIILGFIQVLYNSSYHDFSSWYGFLIRETIQPQIICGYGLCYAFPIIPVFLGAISSVVGGFFSLRKKKKGIYLSLIGLSICLLNFMSFALVAGLFIQQIDLLSSHMHMPYLRFLIFVSYLCVIVGTIAGLAIGWKKVKWEKVATELQR